MQREPLDLRSLQGSIDHPPLAIGNSLDFLLQELKFLFHRSFVKGIKGFGLLFKESFSTCLDIFCESPVNRVFILHELILQDGCTVASINSKSFEVIEGDAKIL